MCCLTGEKVIAKGVTEITEIGVVLIEGVILARIEDNSRCAR